MRKIGQFARCGTKIFNWKLGEKYGCFRNPDDHAEKLGLVWKGLQLIYISVWFERRHVMNFSLGAKRGTESGDEHWRRLCHAPVYQGVWMEVSKS